ncbi:MAG: hypothetical protein MIO92_13505 [Methanosarcinaceae archaeon]|nr:hypothetical protein [Methanosarcinaceae archaeon]
MRDREILKNAFAVFEKNTGIAVNMANLQKNNTKNQNHRADAVIEMNWGNQKLEFVAEVKNVLNRPMVGMIIDRFKTVPQNAILVAPYINPNIAEDLRKNNIQFIDTVGNAYINTPPLFIFLKGQRLPEDIELDIPKNIFNAAGLRIVYALLCNPAMVNNNYREIANEAEVALGTVHNLIKKLTKAGHLVDTGPKGRRLIRKKELLDQWVIEYPYQLRPNLLMGRYQTEQADWWKDVRIREYGGFWGGEVAAYKLTQYLKPFKVTIYMRENYNEFLLANKLRREKNGNVEILEMFRTDDNNQANKETVHPILIYADLMALADSRAVETARMIYDKDIAGLIGKD